MVLIDRGQLHLPPRLLSAIVLDAAMSTDFTRLAPPGVGARASVRLDAGESHDVWLIRWGPGSTSGLHDHGGAAGAFCVVEGSLVERMVAPRGRAHRVVRPVEHRPMSTEHVHEVLNTSGAVATSVHAYSPPLRTMRHYEIDDRATLRVVRNETVTVVDDTRL